MRRGCCESKYKVHLHYRDRVEDCLAFAIVQKKVGSRSGA